MRHVARIEDMKTIYNTSFLNMKKGPYVIPRRRLEDIIKMELKDFGFEDVDWI